uniref:Uncharacterized protein n=1 Tax=Cacopsylla melanoneura TaxID=428564 RepID=A0A8D8ZUB0_9HEMI
MINAFTAFNLIIIIISGINMAILPITPIIIIPIIFFIFLPPPPPPFFFLPSSTMVNIRARLISSAFPEMESLLPFRELVSPAVIPSGSFSLITWLSINLST